MTRAQWNYVCRASCEDGYNVPTWPLTYTSRYVITRLALKADVQKEIMRTAFAQTEVRISVRPYLFDWIPAKDKLPKLVSRVDEEKFLEVYAGDSSNQNSSIQRQNHLHLQLSIVILHTFHGSDQWKCAIYFRGLLADLHIAWAKILHYYGKKPQTDGRGKIFDATIVSMLYYHVAKHQPEEDSLVAPFTYACNWKLPCAPNGPAHCSTKSPATRLHNPEGEQNVTGFLRKKFSTTVSVCHIDLSDQTATRGQEYLLVDAKDIQERRWLKDILRASN